MTTTRSIQAIAHGPELELDRRREIAIAQGGTDRIAQQHAKGRLTARERVALLVEAGTFVELGNWRTLTALRLANELPPTRW